MADIFGRLSVQAGLAITDNYSKHFPRPQYCSILSDFFPVFLYNHNDNICQIFVFQNDFSLDWGKTLHLTLALLGASVKKNMGNHTPLANIFLM